MTSTGYRDKNGSLTPDEFKEAIAFMRKKFPMHEQHVNKLESTFEKYDIDHDGRIDMSELKSMLMDVDNKMTQLPAVSMEHYGIDKIV